MATEEAANDMMRARERAAPLRWSANPGYRAVATGIATAGETPVTVAHYLGLTPKWVDGTAVGGCSFMIHVRPAAAIASGLCETVLITHGEKRPARASGVPAMSWRLPASPASSSSPMGQWGRRRCSRSRYRSA